MRGQGLAPDGELPGLLAVAASALLFAVVAALVKGARLPALLVLEAQGAVETVLGAVAVVLAGVRPVASGWLAARALLYFGFLLCWWRTLALLPVGDAVTLVSVAPIFTAALAWAALGERVDAAFLPVLALNLAGLVLITQPGFLLGGSAHEGTSLEGTCMALLSAVVGGALPVLTRRVAEYHWTVVNGAASLLTAALFAPAGLAARPPAAAEFQALRAESPRLLTACVLGYGALALQTTGYQRARAGRASVMTACQIPFSYFLQWAVFGDRVTRRGLFGSALIVGASAANAWRVSTDVPKRSKQHI